MTSGWRAAGILFTVFAAGGLAGAATVEIFHEEAPVQRNQRGGRGGPPSASTRFGDSDRFVHFLKSRLEITEQQEEDIREILTRSEEEAGSLYESIRPRLESGVEETRAQIRDVLTAEQLERFDAVLSEERGRRRRGRDRESDGRPGQGPDGPPSSPREAPRIDGKAPSAPDAPKSDRRQERDHDHRGTGADGAGEASPTGERLGPIIRA